MMRGDNVEIIWLDSVSVRRTWVDLDEFNFDAHDESMYYKSVGIFLKKTKIATYYCESIRMHNSGGSNVGHVMSIPNKAILSIKQIGTNPDRVGGRLDHDRRGQSKKQ